MIRISQCAFCKHWKEQPSGTFGCPAFPHKIPEEIYWYDFDHRNPYPGDNGIRFEPLNRGAAAFQVEIFGHNPRVSQVMLEILRFAREMTIADTDGRLRLLSGVEPRLDILRAENAIEIAAVSKPNEQRITEMEERLTTLANLPLVIEAEDAKNRGPNQQGICPVCLAILQIRDTDSFTEPCACQDCLAPFYEVYFALSKYLWHAQPTRPPNRYRKRCAE